MPQLDYHKVIKIVAKTLNKESTVEIVPQHDKNDIFDVTLAGQDGTRVSFRLVNIKFKMELYIQRDIFFPKLFDRWIRAFEFELEQVFLTNIKVAVEEDSQRYRLTIST